MAWAAAAIGARRTVVAGVLAVLCSGRRAVVRAQPRPRRRSDRANAQHRPVRPGRPLESIEWNGLWNDMATSKSPRAFVTLPAGAYVRPTSSIFAETARRRRAVPVRAGHRRAGGLCVRRRLPAEIVVPIFVLTVFALYWFVTTSLLRYALLFFHRRSPCAWECCSSSWRGGCRERRRWRSPWRSSPPCRRFRAGAAG